jgi:hypothetical protein
VWTRSERNSNKLQLKFEGPYRVIGERDDCVILDTATSGLRTESKERVIGVPEADDVMKTHDRTTDGNVEYVIKEIIDMHNDDKGHVVYRIRWEGYGDDEDTWEPEASLPTELVLRYLRTRALNKSKPRATTRH